MHAVDRYLVQREISATKCACSTLGSLFGVGVNLRQERPTGPRLPIGSHWEPLFFRTYVEHTLGV